MIQALFRYALPFIIDTYLFEISLNFILKVIFKKYFICCNDWKKKEKKETKAYYGPFQKS